MRLSRNPLLFPVLALLAAVSVHACSGDTGTGTSGNASSSSSSGSGGGGGSSGMVAASSHAHSSGPMPSSQANGSGGTSTVATSSNASSAAGGSSNATNSSNGGNTPCVMPGDPGNDRKVGKYCTVNGGECVNLGLGNAYACTVDHDPTADAFCTKACVQDSQCGTGAVCVGDPDPDGGMNAGLKGCVPTQCL